MDQKELHAKVPEVLASYALFEKALVLSVRAVSPYILRIYMQVHLFFVKKIFLRLFSLPSKSLLNKKSSLNRTKLVCLMLKFPLH